MNESQKKALEDMQKFMKNDMKIKQDLIDTAPNNTYIETEEANVEYSDKMFEKFQEIEDDFSTLSQTFNLGEVEEVLQAKLQEIKNEIINCKLTRTAQSELYTKRFSNMDKELLETVQETLVGYTCNNVEAKTLVPLIQNSKSINELLHVFHYYVMNNEEILQSMPVIEQKMVSQYDGVTLYGTQSSVAKNIYDGLDEKKLGATDIIGLENKAIMMVRDSGHALTVEVEQEPQTGKIFVSYHVPKICNVEKVNQLKGVNKIDEITATGTNGMFYIDNPQELGKEMMEFIESVPTDMDIIQPSGLTLGEEIARDNNMDFEEEKPVNIEPVQVQFTAQDMKQVAEKQKISQMKRYFEKIKNLFNKDKSQENVKTENELNNDDQR